MSSQPRCGHHRRVYSSMGYLQCRSHPLSFDHCANMTSSTPSTSTASPDGSKLVRCAHSTIVTGNSRNMVDEQHPFQHSASYISPQSKQLGRPACKSRRSRVIRGKVERRKPERLNEIHGSHSGAFAVFENAECITMRTIATSAMTDDTG
jgi:hypothetical protein